MTLTEFLLARIAEDEAAYSSLPFDSLSATAEVLTAADVALAYREGITLPGAVVRTRLLSECEAKRRIVEWHRPSDERNRWCDYCRGTEHAEYPCETSRVLALPYADHPDYDESWRC